MRYYQLDTMFIKNNTPFEYSIPPPLFIKELNFWILYGIEHCTYYFMSCIIQKLAKSPYLKKGVHTTMPNPDICLFYLTGGKECVSYWYFLLSGSRNCLIENWIHSSLKFYSVFTYQCEIKWLLVCAILIYFLNMIPTLCQTKLFTSSNAFEGARCYDIILICESFFIVLNQSIWRCLRGFVYFSDKKGRKKEKKFAIESKSL